MRIKFTKFLALFIIFINIFIVYYTWKIFSSYVQENQVQVPVINTSTKPPIKRLNKLITIVIRDFELNDNDITSTVQSFLNVFPNIQVYIIGNGLPYPPLDLLFINTTKNIKLIDIIPDLKRQYNSDYPLSEIKTKYLLYVPDSCRIINKQSVQRMLNDIVKGPYKIIASQIAGKYNLQCLNFNLDLRKWTLNLSKSYNNTCDIIFGKHVTLIERDVIRKISNHHLIPFPQSLYLQSAALNYKIYLKNGSEFQEGKQLFRSHHAKWKKHEIDIDRGKKLYQHFSIKQVLWYNGTTEWYGCTRETPRCFGTVLDSMPSYLFQGKWTPPCCLENLRKTARHVFSVINASGIRYWLESGSLLGAMRNGDILPWDYDVDIGINRDDIKRCIWLVRAKIKSVIDTKGFLWEKATEGNFFRVHFSKINRIYVNIFPFYSRNGTMTRDSWFTSHKNMEFPDRFLHPMSSIQFVGVQVPTPNNIRDFLEIKFGKGAIENPHYPNPYKLKFS